MKYTVILRRSEHLIGVMDDHTSEFYVANGDVEHEDLRSAVHAARLEAAAKDAPDYQYILREQGIKVVGSVNITSDNYEVIMAIEGQHKPIYGWEPQLAMFQ